MLASLRTESGGDTHFSGTASCEIEICSTFRRQFLPFHRKFRRMVRLWLYFVNCNEKILT